MPETPEERQRRLSIEIGQRAQLFKKLVDEFGPRVLEITQQNLIEEVRAWIESLPLPQRNLPAMLHILWNQVGTDLDYTIEEQTPEHMKMCVTRCMWADEFRKRDAGDIGYSFYCASDYGYCQGLNPKIKFSRTKTLMQGDDCCDHTYDLPAADSVSSGD
ncbi:MAG: L-2-amino-thiazoline-4-carboxylic acid hydrolase [Chloroflexi bacterium]|nr:L-2-amino-thiazoline-4-carboxylic acid hydrolase [Chloroflexota bacterium]